MPITTTQQAIIILLKALDLGQQKGSYTLQEANLLAKARKFFLIENFSCNEIQRENAIPLMMQAAEKAQQKGAYDFSFVEEVSEAIIFLNNEGKKEQAARERAMEEKKKKVLTEENMEMSTEKNKEVLTEKLNEIEEIEEA